MRLQIRPPARLCFALALVLCGGCATHFPAYMTKTERIATPPAGKALVNFHRPTSHSTEALYSIFLGDGSFIGDLPGESVIQYVCAPGQCHFMGQMQHVSVIEANLASDKVYDVVIDVAMGWTTANINMTALTKDSPRRVQLPDYEKRELHVLATQRVRYVIEYEQKSQPWIQEAKRDFLGGPKSSRVEHIKPDDCR